MKKVAARRRRPPQKAAKASPVSPMQLQRLDTYALRASGLRKQLRSLNAEAKEASERAKPRVQALIAAAKRQLAWFEGRLEGRKSQKGESRK